MPPPGDHLELGHGVDHHFAFQQKLKVRHRFVSLEAQGTAESLHPMLVRHELTARFGGLDIGAEISRTLPLPFGFGR